MNQRIIDRSYVGEVLQRIYQSKLDISLSLNSAGGYFFLAQGDRRVALEGTSIEEAVTNLASRVVQDFPESEFASWWIVNFQQINESR